MTLARTKQEQKRFDEISYQEAAPGYAYEPKKQKDLELFAKVIHNPSNEVCQIVAKNTTTTPTTYILKKVYNPKADLVKNVIASDISEIIKAVAL